MSFDLSLQHVRYTLLDGSCKGWERARTRRVKGPSGRGED